MAEGSDSSIGARLRAAREAKGLSLEDIVTRTRIPTRHLASIEEGDWDSLPATTYTVGFARSYANAIGLNGSEIASELREQLGLRQNPEPTASYYEPADPARVPPKLLLAATAVIILVLVGGYMVWRTNLEEGPAVAEVEIAEPAAPPAGAPTPQPAAPAPAPATGPVVLTASAEVWLRIYEAGGAKLFEGTMQPGQRYEVPATATAPMILTGRPDAVAVSVGSTAIPPLGPAQRTIADVSLLPRDLLARVQQPGAPGTPAAGAPVAGAAPAAAPPAVGPASVSGEAAPLPPGED